MLKNLIKISLRLIKRNRTYSAINFFGLSLGLFTFILIYLYVNYELSYDRYHKNYDTIYRVFKETKSEFMGSNKFGRVQAPVAGVIRDQLPEVDQVGRILRYDNLLITVGNESFFENQYNAVDPEVFNIFSIEIIAGNSTGILAKPRSIVLNETLAKKYFGSAENAIGKTISAQTWSDLGEFEIESVIKDMPDNSHFTMKVIFQFETIVNIIQPGDLTNWNNNNYWCYLTLNPGTDIAKAEAKLKRAIDPNLNNTDPPAYRLQPLSNIYLGPSVNSDIAPTGNLNRLYVFSCIGVLVLLIACVNYVNMATARASSRAKEIGIRKVTGAKRSELIWQFIGEALLMTFLCMAVAYLATLIALPYFNAFLEKNITLDFQSQPGLIILLAGLTLLVGIGTGIYPALILSSFKPTLTLKGVVRGSNSYYLRDALVIFQFIISGALIFATLVVWKQMEYVENKNLGFNRNQIVIVRLRDKVLQGKAGVIKEKLLQNPSIVKVAASSRPPSLVVSNQGRTWQAKHEEKSMQVYYCEIDSSFLNLYEIKLLAGTNLSVSNNKNDVIINESLVKELGYSNEEIVGTLFVHGDSTNVIGVVKDFHFQDFKQKIQPLRLKNFTWGPPSYLSLKIREINMQGTLKFVEETLNAISDKYPVEYSFYDDIYYQSYNTEIKTGKLMGWFSGIAIFIATLGLYGLVLFMLNQRIREIGIRKVLGASPVTIIRLLSTHFAVLIIIGYAIACAVGFYSMKEWLNEFAYKVPLSIDVFLLTLVAMMAITGFTIFFRVRQATLVNPAEILKHE